MEIKSKKTNIFLALSKRPLKSTGIFLFNVQKAFLHNDGNYKVFEEIKDGWILASKFDSKELRFKTPNAYIQDS